MVWATTKTYMLTGWATKRGHYARLSTSSECLDQFAWFLAYCNATVGDGGGGHWLVRMEWRAARWSVCLPLLIFPCTIKSRSSVLAPADPGGPRKRAVKWLCVCVCNATLFSTLLILYLSNLVPATSDKINNLAFAYEVKRGHCIRFHSYGHFYAVLFWTSLLSSFSSTFLQSDATWWKTTTCFPLLKNKYWLC